jgi:hypothetical protein
MEVNMIIRDQVKELDKATLTNVAYLKLCQNKTHFGPVSQEIVDRQKAKRLEAAANKLRVTAGFKVQIKKDNPSQESRNIKDNVSFVLCSALQMAEPDLVKDAILALDCWDKSYVDGTSDYRRKYASFIEQRNRVYTSLGVNPNGNMRPDLTADNRKMYNEQMAPYAFDCYEYHLAVKLPGNKGFIRSKTYRSLTPMNKVSIIEVLNGGISKNNSKIELVAQAPSN